MLNHKLTTSPSYAPTQADVKCFQAFKNPPKPENYPYAYRWYKHIASFEPEFSSLPGDPSKAYTAYGPEASTLPINTKAPNAEEDDDDVDLFGSDDEEVDEEAEKLKAQRLEEYRKKKEGKAKPAAKSLVTMDVKPWGRLYLAALVFDKY
jgi:elongation factor 1-beta